MFGFIGDCIVKYALNLGVGCNLRNYFVNTLPEINLSYRE